MVASLGFPLGEPPGRRDRRPGGKFAWDDASAGLPTASRAQLLCHRSGWHHNRSNITAALADLATAAALIDPDRPTEDPRALAHARQHLRTRLATLNPSDLSRVPLPNWATTPLPQAVINLAHRWITADWPQRQQILTTPDPPTDRELLRVLATVYCDHPELQHWLDVIDDINTRGQHIVFTEMDAAHATMSLLQDWMSTPSWNASQAYLTAHPALRSPDTIAALETLARQRGDEVARQLLLHVARTGNAELITETWHATPHLAADPCTATLTTALAHALSDEADDPDELDQALRAAAALANAATPSPCSAPVPPSATTEPSRRIATAITQGAPSETPAKPKLPASPAAQ